jgi:hypothetical protein
MILTCSACAENLATYFPAIFFTCAQTDNCHPVMLLQSEFWIRKSGMLTPSTPTGNYVVVI